MTRRSIVGLGLSTLATDALKLGGMTLAGAGIKQLLWPEQAAFAADSTMQVGSSSNVIVVVFMRGAVDGLSMLAPYTEAAYYRDRPGISIAAPISTISDPGQAPKNARLVGLDDRFGLHPELSKLKPIYDRGDLAFVHAIGSPTTSRSHFDAQDQMEAGTISFDSASSGWLNRALKISGRGEIHNSGNKSEFFRGVAIGDHMPRILRGDVETISIRKLKEMGINRKSPFLAGLHAMYDKEGQLHQTGFRALRAIEALQNKVGRRYTPENGATYAKDSNKFREVARLLKADLGIDSVVVDFGGWDTHAGQGAAQGSLANKFRKLAKGLASFSQDMGERMKKVTVVTISEFGRTVAQNGSAGTDHGHGTAMLAMGAGVSGGKVYGRWPGIEPEQRYEGRDLAVTTDYRQFLAELLSSRWGVSDPTQIFPNYHVSANKIGIFG